MPTRQKIERRLLIVDDTLEDRESLKHWLADSDVYEYSFVECDSIETGVEVYHAQNFDCIILDYSFPTGTALNFFDLIKKGDSVELKAPVVVMTGHGSENVAVRTLKIGAHDYISKGQITTSTQPVGHVIDQAIKDFVKTRDLKAMQKQRDKALTDLQTNKNDLEASVSELRRAKQNAEAATIAKSAFLSNMSHEIRSPLTAIIGFTDLLQAQDLSVTERTDYLQTIQRSGKHLLSVINEILDFSKVESGKITVKSAAIELVEFLGDIVGSFREQANKKQIGLRSFVHPSLPKLVYSDPTRLRQIVTNLLSNAVKFTSEGEVAVIVQPEPRTDKFDQISISVTDSGIGISKLDAKNLFKRFSQANDSIGANFGGTGIGLVLSKKLAGLLGGSLELVSSEPGVGSLFKLIVPSLQIQQVDRIHQQSETKYTIDSLAGCRILLADDSFDNQLLLRRVLEKAGALVNCASNGVELIELSHEREFDIILMDVQMPIMDGHEAARILRQEGMQSPIIGLTAFALQEDRIKSAAAGFSDQLTKPIDMIELVKTIKGFTENKSFSH